MKNIFKIIAVITTLLIATFTFGCSSPVETQQSKYEKLEKQYIQICQKLTNETINKKRKANTDKEIIQLNKELYEKVVKETKSVLNEMNKVAKGNPELEKKVETEKKFIESCKKHIEEIKNGTYNPLII